MVGDTGDPAHCAAAVATAIDRFGGLDVVVPNAAVEAFGSVTEIGLEDPEKVWPPLPTVVVSVAVTVYEITGAPPSLAGGVKTTDATVFPAVATTPVGGPGATAGITGTDDTDGTEVAASLLAVTANVYESPFVRPVTEIGLEDPVTDWPPLPTVVVSVAVTV